MSNFLTWVASQGKDPITAIAGKLTASASGVSGSAFALVQHDFISPFRYDYSGLLLIALAAICAGLSLFFSNRLIHRIHEAETTIR